jgi:hypothetical protein
LIEPSERPLHNPSLWEHHESCLRPLHYRDFSTTELLNDSCKLVSWIALIHPNQLQCLGLGLIHFMYANGSTSLLWAIGVDDNHAYQQS